LDQRTRQEGQNINLGGNGNPCRYTATTEHLIPSVIAEPPGARGIWTCGESDVLTEKWEGTVVDRTAAGACHPDELLLVEAWDES
jgi:hypothetical protein